MTAQIIAFGMQKGGVGKTTTTLNVGVELANLGKRVLLVDIDPQANLTSGLGVNPRKLDYSVYEVLLNPGKGAAFAILDTKWGPDLIPSTLALAGAELELAGLIGREMLLREALSKVVDQYDYILIDPPPSLGIFTVNAFTAAHEVIVPLQAHIYALDAMPQLQATIGLVQKLNARLKIGGIVVTMYNKSTNLSQQVEQEVKEQFGELVFNATIPLTTKLAEAPAAGEPISIYAPGTPAAVAYKSLAVELEERYAA